MDSGEKRRLEDVYRRYGFEVARTYESDQVVVFTLKTGYFDNADIVPLSVEASLERAFHDFSQAGYACTKRPVQSAAQAEEQLFKGFFSVESILGRLDSDYKRFTGSIVAPFADDAKYTYINAPYLINGTAGTNSPAEEVLSRLHEPKPILFLIEAAAGFGKTCTAYELVHLLTQRAEQLPLFSELSRNRQARVFRYILLDEIDRTFPVLSSRLVQAEMLNGRVVTILDGFDELLRKTEDGGEFEQREPMLETIGAFLTGKAKIVLTTRRTVLFEGDAFHTWIDQHAEDFDFVRVRITEPDVTHWLPPDRLGALTHAGLNVGDIANPVVLSYLRCIPQQRFDDILRAPDLLVNKYFEFMLDRERTRQDLRMDAVLQERVLSSIAEDMMAFGYTSEQRDYIVDHIQRTNSRLLDEVLLAYPAADRPDKEELANKLASHALLDRSTREHNKIGFINEFVFGHFIAKNILRQQDWLSDDLRFIEPAVISFQPRPDGARQDLWSKLRPSVEFLPISDQIDISIRLQRAIEFDLTNDSAEGLEIESVHIGSSPIENFQFNECTFKNCAFDLANFRTVTFLNCRFYENNLIGSIPGGPIYLLGCQGDTAFIQSLQESLGPTATIIEPDRELLLQRFVLEKFWPVGRETVTHKHRPIQGICVNSGEFKPHELYEAISTLKKRGILLSPMKASFLELNFDEFAVIREILGR
jgi:hypothetical protein